VEEDTLQGEEEVHALGLEPEVEIRRFKTNIPLIGEPGIHQGPEVKVDLRERVLKAKIIILRVVVNPLREKGEGHALGL